MKLITIVNARLALQKLVEQPLPLRKAWQVMQLTERCNIHLQFYGDRLQKLGPEPELEKVMELREMEISDLDALVKISLPLDSELQLSASDIKNLQPFVDFEEG